MCSGLSSWCSQLETVGHLHRVLGHPFQYGKDHGHLSIPMMKILSSHTQYSLLESQKDLSAARSLISLFRIPGDQKNPVRYKAYHVSSHQQSNWLLLLTPCIMQGVFYVPVAELPHFEKIFGVKCRPHQAGLCLGFKALCRTELQVGED